MSPLQLTLAALILTYAALKLRQWLKRRRRLVQAIERLPGPPTVPFAPLVNHALVMLYLDSVLKHRLGSFVIIYHLISTLYTLFPNTGICRFWLGWKPIVVLFSPENVEQVLNSTQVINKADEYRFFEPWIGEGLVTSRRNKWRFRRKILTPAFHFRILNDFLPIMNKEASKLVSKLNECKFVCSHCGEQNAEASINSHDESRKQLTGKQVDIVPLVALCTLDTICETAMGVNLNCQHDVDGRQSAYVSALNKVGEMALTRVTRPWLWFDAVFRRTQTGRAFERAKDYMHDFSTKVILERKREWQLMLAERAKARQLLTQSRSSAEPSSAKAPQLVKQQEQEQEERAEKKMSFDEVMQSSLFRAPPPAQPGQPESQAPATTTKRLAFLDLMLHQHLVERTMSIDDIREEVDTFMFAGHDTTAMSISWTIYMLGLHTQIQSRVRAELDSVLGPFKASSVPCDQQQQQQQQQQQSACPHLAPALRLDDISVEQLRELRYLDLVIKESLRMWPSIPFVARQMTEDLEVGSGELAGGGKYLIPRGATCMIFTHALHNNPKYYPNPHQFDPDRFLPENMAGRHPFAYIPFSAGPRNCIGQRFAQMELKVILAKFIRNFNIVTHDHRDKLEIVGELVLRSRNGLKVQLIPRAH